MSDGWTLVAVIVSPMTEAPPKGKGREEMTIVFSAVHEPLTSAA